MMEVFRTPALTLEDRIDVNFYRPIYRDNIALLDQFGTDNFRSLYSASGIGHTAAVEPHYAQDGAGVPFVAGKSFGEGWLRLENSERIRRESHDGAMKKSKLKPGYLLVVRKGDVGNACVVPTGAGELNCSSEVMFFVIEDSGDAHFLSAFLNSAHGRLATERLRRGSLIAGLSLLDIPELEVLRVSQPARQYIGDKVRYAERLREAAAEQLGAADQLFENEVQASAVISSHRLFRRISPQLLFDRLDARFNSPKRIELLDHLESRGLHCPELRDLAEVSAMIGWKGLTTEFYRDKGPWLLRGVEFDNGVIDWASLVSVESEKYREQPQIHLIPGDIAFTKDGTIGKAIVIPELSNAMAAGSTVARIRILSAADIAPHYLEYVLNHDVVRLQVDSFATGMAQPHITQQWIVQLRIPRTECEASIDKHVRQHHSMLAFADLSLTAATTLVESLVEGRLSESELADAQLQLERGESAADIAILSRLHEGGIDATETRHLFSSIEQYRGALQCDEASDRAGEQQ